MINKILLVAESKQVRDFARVSLEAGGFDVLVASDVTAAQHALTLHPFDLVIANVAVAALLRLKRSTANLRVLTVGDGESDKAILDRPHSTSAAQTSALVWPFSAIDLLAGVWDLDLSRRSFGRLEPAMTLGAACSDA